MKPYVGYAALALITGTMCFAQDTGAIRTIKNAPFSAEFQGLNAHASDSLTWTAQVARSSSGSVYQAHFFTSGVAKDSLNNMHIRILDASSGCNLYISPFVSQRHQASNGTWLGGMAGLSINLYADRSEQRSVTVEDLRRGYARQQQQFIETPQRDMSEGMVRRSSLGEREVDGTALFGLHMESAPDAERHFTQDEWESDLGFTYSFRSTNLEDGSTQSFSAAHVKLAEPDPALFTVQEKYFPPTDVFSNAKTVFVSASAGDANLQRRIASILTASGHLTAAPDAQSADLTVHLRPLSPPAPSASDQEMEMQFRRPGNEIPVSIVLHLQHASVDWTDAPVVSTCFANLWSQMEALPISTPAPDGEKF
ncbi:hypothetical protein [Silvibacterium dinghuense]|uniref:Uncharacterized protein n=1 Tax=Silvibacterium dinghuense TaxID=1560006 RepID=A0A4V1NUX4_9BACT|nr:hypothetical protein [Silvibacterium dinghuense]RXS93764.1 hypothetical protein ESZ00_17100 [Silvibacterium dinghuense]GGH07423.1 hypothetical protein GCM10011586_24670 [Silvibacterium dinghuense]